MKNYVKFFSKPIGSSVTFRKFFHYILQLGLIPGNIRNLGFVRDLKRHKLKTTITGIDRFRGGKVKKGSEEIKVASEKE